MQGTPAGIGCLPAVSDHYRVPVMARRQFLLVLRAGFTLIELVIVIAVLGIMSAYFLANDASNAELSLPSQAQTMASNIRYTQTLAHATGNRMRLSITTGANGTYTRSCVTGTCDSVTVALEKNVVLGVVSGYPSTIDFDTLGQPSAEARFTLTSGSAKTVKVEAITGFVTVKP